MMNDDASNDWSSSSDGDDDALATINLTSEMDKTTPTHAELAGEVAVGAVLSTLCLITVLGNTLVIHAVRTDRKLQTVCAAHCSVLYYIHRVPYFFGLYVKNRYTRRLYWRAEPIRCRQQHFCQIYLLPVHASEWCWNARRVLHFLQRKFSQSLKSIRPSAIDVWRFCSWRVGDWPCHLDLWYFDL